MLDFFVKFDALIAHRTPFELRTGATLIGRLIFKTIEGENCSLRDLEQFNSVRLSTLLRRSDRLGDQAIGRDPSCVPAFNAQSTYIAFEAADFTGGSHRLSTAINRTALTRSTG